MVRGEIHSLNTAEKEVIGYKSINPQPNQRKTRRLRSQYKNHDWTVLPKRILHRYAVFT